MSTDTSEPRASVVVGSDQDVAGAVAPSHMAIPTEPDGPERSVSVATIVPDNAVTDVAMIRLPRRWRPRSMTRKAPAGTIIPWREEGLVVPAPVEKERSTTAEVSPGSIRARSSERPPDVEPPAKYQLVDGVDAQGATL
jgi:hypothetical protein